MKTDKFVNCIRLCSSFHKISLEICKRAVGGPPLAVWAWKCLQRYMDLTSQPLMHQVLVAMLNRQNDHCYYCTSAKMTAFRAIDILTLEKRQSVMHCRCYGLCGN